MPYHAARHAAEGAGAGHHVGEVRAVHQPLDVHAGPQVVHAAAERQLVRDRVGQRKQHAADADLGEIAPGLAGGHVHHARARRRQRAPERPVLVFGAHAALGHHADAPGEAVAAVDEAGGRHDEGSRRRIAAVACHRWRQPADEHRQSVARIGHAQRRGVVDHAGVADVVGHGRTAHAQRNGAVALHVHAVGGVHSGREARKASQGEASPRNHSVHLLVIFCRSVGIFLFTYADDYALSSTLWVEIPPRPAAPAPAPRPARDP